MRDHFRRAALIAPALLLAFAGDAEAHPHVFVAARAEIVFDAAGDVTAVRNIWQFDEAFSAYAVQGLDTDNDGKLSDAELAPLAQVNVDSLKEYGYFTWLTTDGHDVPLAPPNEYWLETYEGRLTLFFTLPLQNPARPGGNAMLEIYDPEYFVAFTFDEKSPVKLVDAPATCAAAYHAPRELDASTMSLLAAIPADQRDLPPELVEAASALSNHITLKCP